MHQLSSKNRLSISNFTFERIDRLGWKVCFYSTKTNKCWAVIVPNSIICEIGCNPKQKDLITLKNFVKMETIKYYLVALTFISSACLLAYIGRRIVQKICYNERGNEYRNLDFKTWVAEVWKFENKLL